eukprot:gene8587-8769_t
MEFSVLSPGAAQLTREGPWFMLDEASVARSIETVAIVATLIATFSFTGFLQPPGGWTPQGTAVALNPKVAAAGLEAPFMVFATFNTIALAASMSLVVLIAVGNSFGWKAQEMMWVLHSGFVLLALAALSAFAAFAAAARVLSPSHGLLLKAIISILVVAIALTAVWLWRLLAIVQAKSRRDAYNENLQKLARVLKELLNNLRALNNSYVTVEGVVIGDIILAHYFNCYTVLMLVTLMPLFEQFVKQVEQIKARRVYWRQGVADLVICLRRLTFYWKLWVSTTFPPHPGVQWDVGLEGVQYMYLPLTQFVPTVTGGTWPAAAVTNKRETSVLFKGDKPDRSISMRSPAHCMVSLESAASMLISELLAGEASEATAKQYLGRVKCMFLWANLSAMMPDSVRAAVKQKMY